MQKLFGNVIPMVTPLTGEDTIDVGSLKRLVDHCISKGMNCLYPCGTTGEMMYLTVAERKKVAEVTIEHASGRVPVFVQAGEWNLKDTIELAQHAAAAGADGIGVIIPVFYQISDLGLIDFYKSVAGSVSGNFPVYLYSIPQNAVNDISPAVAAEIAGTCRNVIGIKYSYPDMTKIQRFMTIRDGDFSVLVGPDHLFEAVCAVGGDGVVSGNAMIIPEHYAAIWYAVCKKDFDLATKLQRRTNVLNSVMCRHNNIAAYKVLLKHMGIFSTVKTRRPIPDLTPGQEEELLKEMKELRYREVII